MIVNEIDLPVIVDAGIGAPSQACEAMELGVDAVMANTAVATAKDVGAMAKAFKLAIEAGRLAYLAGLGRVLDFTGEASSFDRIFRRLTEHRKAGNDVWILLL